MSIIRLQFFVLLAGTAFAWYNVMREFVTWYEGKKCKTGCPNNIKNPFLSPCFGGAIFFSIAFILNILI